jgi:hypothetical protein
MGCAYISFKTTPSRASESNTGVGIPEEPWNPTSWYPASSARMSTTCGRVGGGEGVGVGFGWEVRIGGGEGEGIVGEGGGEGGERMEIAMITAKKARREREKS